MTGNFRHYNFIPAPMLLSFDYVTSPSVKDVRSRKMPTTSDRPENDNHIRKKNINNTDYFSLPPFTVKLKKRPRIRKFNYSLISE